MPCASTSSGIPRKEPGLPPDSTSAENRSRSKRSPSGTSRGKRGGRRGRKPASQRIQEDAAARNDLWLNGDASGRRDLKVPMRTQTEGLAKSLDISFRALRSEQTGLHADGPSLRGGGR